MAEQLNRAVQKSFQDRTHGFQGNITGAFSKSSFPKGLLDILSWGGQRLLLSFTFLEGTLSAVGYITVVWNFLCPRQGEKLVTMSSFR